MIYLLHGSDTWGSLKKLHEIVSEFRRKNGRDLNIYRFDAEETEPALLKNILGTNSLFASKKLAIIKYLAHAPSREAILAIIEKFKSDPAVLLCLWERELEGKKLAELKLFCSETQEFKQTKAKLPEMTIFQLGDTYFSSPREGLRSLLQLLSQGLEEKNIFAYLASHLRTLLTVKTYAEQKLPLPSSSGIHPYVAQKAALVVRPHTVFSLTEAFKQFFHEDAKIKTGLSKPRESLFSLLFLRK